MKRIIVAGNWKMNKTYLEAKEFIAKLNQLKSIRTETILATPSLYIDTLYTNNQNENVHLALQNCSSFEEGAYTGEVSARMIASLSLKYCIVGHSERRQYFGETDDIISDKVEQLNRYKVSPILCVGETLKERESDDTLHVLRRQIIKGLKNIAKEDVHRIIVAYEPVWAIGTGITATNEQAQESHRFIYQLLSEIYDEDVASNIPLLYGGSCNENNARELFSQSNIWGGLIGGASLKFDSFQQIIQIAEQLNG